MSTRKPFATAVPRLPQCRNISSSLLFRQMTGRTSVYGAEGIKNYVGWNIPVDYSLALCFPCHYFLSLSLSLWSFPNQIAIALHPRPHR